MIQVTEPQVWVLIGVFAAALFGVIGIVSGSFVRVLRSEIGRIDARLDGLRGELDAHLTSIERRLDGLDRDVSALTRRVMGQDPA